MRIRDNLVIFFMCFLTAGFSMGHALASGGVNSSPGFSRQGNPAGEKEKLNVGLMVSSSSSQMAPTLKELFAWLRSEENISAGLINTGEVMKSPDLLMQYDILWIDKNDSVAFSREERGKKFLSALKKFTERGGKLLLTNRAVHYLNFLDYEPVKLVDSVKLCTDAGFGRRLGFHSFMDHPIFNGLNGGAYIQWPDMDLKVTITGCFGRQIPQKSRVLAVDWDYIFLREETKLVMEYLAGNGRILAIGGYVDFTTPNRNRLHLERFAKNCLDYLAGNDIAFSYWDYSSAKVSEEKTNASVTTPAPVIPPPVAWSTETSPLAMERRYATENFWDVAGERLLTMGTENGGIEEVWAHPFMAFRDYEVGIRFSYRDTIFWLNDERPEIEVSPGYFSRVYKFGRAYLTEVIVNHPMEAAGGIHYQYRGVYPAQLLVRLKSNLRMMWPFSEKVTGSLYHHYDSNRNAWSVRSENCKIFCMVGSNRVPLHYLSGQYDGFITGKRKDTIVGIPSEKIQVSGLFVWNLEMNDNLDVVFSASGEGQDIAIEAYDRWIREPQAILQASLGHTTRLLSGTTMITTPDENFNKGYRWALLATDRFFVHTPGLGKALTAGYATTRHGWDGQHKINGRPGYGWYFGRDASWSGFALIDYGDFDKVRSQLEFFSKYQDLTGKIFHEASTSGFFHYDAADATPLYIVLAGKYFRHSNDTIFLRNHWPSVKKAIDFCFSTDTDKDRLIENTNVGHGWVEGGKLYGSHSTIYMAGCWGAALREAALMAEAMKSPDAEFYRLESAEQQYAIDNRFWDDKKQFYAYGMNKDQSFRQDQTILPAVPIYFRMADRNKSQLCTRVYAGNNFTTNWGCRILGEDHPWFKPTGYHYGSVWPLFTGWASLAGYSTGNGLLGFSLLMNNLNVYKQWGLGFVEEVLNGSEYEPSGVCAHQCWSETMVLQPSIEGLLGLEVNAPASGISLSPNLPVHWDSLIVSNIKVGNRNFTFTYHRNETTYEYKFSVSEGPAISVDFMPYLPPQTQIQRILLDGKAVPVTIFKALNSICPVISTRVEKDARLVIETSGGKGLLPVVQDPRPGEHAEGLRIISAVSREGEVVAELEAPAETVHEISFWRQAEDSPSANGADFLRKEGKISTYRVEFGESTSKYSIKKVTFK